MIRTPTRGQAVRCLRLARLLVAAPNGATVGELLREQQCGRATLYRDLDLLREAGWPVEEASEGGLAVYRIRAAPQPYDTRTDSLPARILAALVAPERAYHLAARIGASPHRTAVALARLAALGRVARVGRGLFAPITAAPTR